MSYLARIQMWQVMVMTQTLHDIIWIMITCQYMQDKIMMLMPLAGVTNQSTPSTQSCILIIWNPDTLYVLAHTCTYRVHTEYDHAL